MKKRMYTIKKILSPELQEVHAFLVSMRYTLKALKELYPLEVKFIRDRCKELHLKGFDELIEKLELGIKYDANGERILLNEDEKESSNNRKRKRILIEFQGIIFQSKKQLANYLGRSMSFVTSELEKEDSVFKIVGFDARRRVKW
jgi:hypothetical protein